jgi:hypothetical protein
MRHIKLLSQNYPRGTRGNSYKREVRINDSNVIQIITVSHQFLISCKTVRSQKLFVTYFERIFFV